MEYIEYLNLPAKALVIIAIVFGGMQLIGKFLEFKGMVVPEILSIKKYFERKKAEREAFVEMQQTLAQVKKTLDEFNAHYNEESISKRNTWMQGVDDKQERDHKWIEKLDKKLDQINSDTLELKIENKRSEIISFASYVINEKNPVTREQFRRIFKAHKDYEALIKDNGLTNGEVDTALRIIQEAYEEHMRTHTFVEYTRGYETPGHSNDF